MPVIILRLTNVLKSPEEVEEGQKYLKGTMALANDPELRAEFHSLDSRDRSQTATDLGAKILSGEVAMPPTGLSI